jgi:hypothetical protein
MLPLLSLNTMLPVLAPIAGGGHQAKTAQNTVKRVSLATFLHNLGLTGLANPG